MASKGRGPTRAPPSAQPGTGQRPRPESSLTIRPMNRVRHAELFLDSFDLAARSSTKSTPGTWACTIRRLSGAYDPWRRDRHIGTATPATCTPYPDRRLPRDGTNRAGEIDLCRFFPCRGRRGLQRLGGGGIRPHLDRGPELRWLHGACARADRRGCSRCQSRVARSSVAAPPSRSGWITALRLRVSEAMWSRAASGGYPCGPMPHRPSARLGWVRRTGSHIRQIQEQPSAPRNSRISTAGS